MAREADNAGERRGGRWTPAVWGGAAVLLLLPWVAMRLTDEVAWDGTDFIVFGAMLLVACGTYELVSRTTGDRTYRFGVGLAVAAAFLLVWVNLAVGILGGEGNPANLLFAGVIGVAALGSLVARFRPTGMARAMLAAAAAQALVGAVALAAGWASDGPRGLHEVAMGTSLFGGLWLASAWLFRRAARGQTAP